MSIWGKLFGSLCSKTKNHEELNKQLNEDNTSPTETPISICNNERVDVAITEMYHVDPTPETLNESFESVNLVSDDDELVYVKNDTSQSDKLNSEKEKLTEKEINEIFGFLKDEA